MSTEERKALAKRLLSYASEYERIIGKAAGIGRMIADLRTAAEELSTDAQ